MKMEKIPQAKYHLVMEDDGPINVPSHVLALCSIETDAERNIRTIVPKYYNEKKALMNALIRGESQTGRKVRTAHGSNETKTELCCGESTSSTVAREKSRERQERFKRLKGVARMGSLFGSSGEDHLPPQSHEPATTTPLATEEPATTTLDTTGEAAADQPPGVVRVFKDGEFVRIPLQTTPKLLRNTRRWKWKNCVRS